MIVQQFILAFKKASIKLPHHTLVRELIHQWPVDSPHKGPVIHKKLQCHNSIMTKKITPISSQSNYGVFVASILDPLVPTYDSGFPAQRAFNAESISMSCDHHMTAQSQQQQIAPKTIQIQYNGNLFQWIKNVWKNYAGIILGMDSNERWRYNIPEWPLLWLVIPNIEITTVYIISANCNKWLSTIWCWLLPGSDSQFICKTHNNIIHIP